MTGPPPSMDALLATGAVVLVPGLLHWLGIPESQETEPEETWEQLCVRLNSEAAS
ncbi:hypothetical protein [Streptomyces liliifuscus]|uniref:Uncharacterized protein n=1 Tax=Streptomyces liliifuscus TaxID=2797636 RepID=A0A7T7L295_9ACTN|nr:hypothetical protein [Streptomyces liliifuscus]QQM45109.1 hypothetical protein JEQ17_40740 [Streptomyces liliifuscus]